MQKTLILVLGTLILAMSLQACVRTARTTTDVPHKISPSYDVAVAPFTQPTNPSELIMGRIPEPQGPIVPEDLARLDTELRAILQQDSTRHYVFLKAPLKRPATRYHNSAQPQALDAWVQYGRQNQAKLLLVPQIFTWYERNGSRAGVTTSAEVHAEFFLIRVDKGVVMHRTVFNEKQQALTENLLKIGDFIKRKAAWITATDLAKEGMVQAKQEMGL